MSDIKSKEKNKALLKMGVSVPADPKHIDWVIDASDASDCKPRDFLGDMPKTLADCPYSSGDPCPWFRCRHNLYLSVFNERVKFSAPGVEFWQLEETCSIRLADRGGMTLEECGEAMNLTRERVRQVQEEASTGSPRAASIGGAAKKFMEIPEAVSKDDIERCKRLWAASRKV